MAAEATVCESERRRLTDDDFFARLRLELTWTLRRWYRAKTAELEINNESPDPRRFWVPPYIFPPGFEGDLVVCATGADGQELRRVQSINPAAAFASPHRGRRPRRWEWEWSLSMGAAPSTPIW